MSLEIKSQALEAKLLQTDQTIEQTSESSCTPATKVACSTLASLGTVGATGAVIQGVNPGLITHAAASTGSLLLAHPLIGGTIAAATLATTCGLRLLCKCYNQESQTLSIDLQRVWSTVSKSRAGVEYTEADYQGQLARDFRGPWQVNINDTKYLYQKDCPDNSTEIARSIADRLDKDLEKDQELINKVLSFTSQTGIMGIKNHVLETIKTEFCPEEITGLMGSDGSGDDEPITSSVTITKTACSVDAKITGSLTLKIKGFGTQGELYIQEKPITVKYSLDVTKMKSQFSGVSGNDINLTKA